MPRSVTLLRVVMAEVRTAVRRKNAMETRWWISRGLRIDKVDGLWQIMTKLAEAEPPTWDALRERCKSFPTRRGVW